MRWSDTRLSQDILKDVHAVNKKKTEKLVIFIEGKESGKKGQKSLAGTGVAKISEGSQMREKTCKLCSRTGHGASLPKRHRTPHATSVRRKNTFANIASLLERGRLPNWSRQQTLTRQRRLRLCQPHSVAEGCAKFRWGVMTRVWSRCHICCEHSGGVINAHHWGTVHRDPGQGARWYTLLLTTDVLHYALCKSWKHSICHRRLAKT